jgi:hypothetical protein
MSTFSKQISQETFDSVVQENVDDFDMTKEAALADAIEQFKMQGVDLSSIDVTGGIGREEVITAIMQIKDSECADEDLVEALTTLAGLCSESCDLSERNLNLVHSNETMYPTLCLLKRDHGGVISAVLKTLLVLTRKHSE